MLGELGEPQYSGWARNGDVRIHYYDSSSSCNQETDGLPLVLCPGLSETAEEYLDLLQALLPRRTILLSFRGRGGSDTPMQGYDLDDHIGDLEAVIAEARLSTFHLMGNSRGAAYALGYALRQPAKVRSLIVGDYPPEHRSMSETWPRSYIYDYLIPSGRHSLIREQAVYGIQRNSTQVELKGNLAMPLMVARGGLSDSMLSEADVGRYRAMSKRLVERVYEQSGHAITGSDRSALYEDIAVFLRSCE